MARQRGRRVQTSGHSGVEKSMAGFMGCWEAGSVCRGQGRRKQREKTQDAGCGEAKELKILQEAERGGGVNKIGQSTSVYKNKEVLLPMGEAGKRLLKTKLAQDGPSCPESRQSQAFCSAERTGETGRGQGTTFKRMTAIEDTT